LDVRVVVASNRPLKTLVDEGAFRLDLFYRISTFPITLPPLRERPGDLLPLVEHFSRVAADRLRLAAPRPFAPEALQALSSHAWPGNVRELENAVEYACIVSGEREVILRSDLPEEISGSTACPPRAAAGLVVTEQGMSLRNAVSNLERELILQSMRLADGNKARAAELLDLKRTTFLEKLRRLEGEGREGHVTDWTSPAKPAEDLG
jgi:DNA-binding NtrC family response regulator